MAQDDMHVVIYKMLAYLYSCLKKGEKPVERHYTHDGDVLNIPYKYWASIIKEMQDKGYVRGFVIADTWGGGIIICSDDPCITMDGVEFLQDNSKMKMALRFLRETKSTLPFL